MFESTRWTYEENENQKFDAQIIATVKNPTSSPMQKREIGIIRRFEFSSKLQRMSVIVKNLTDSNFRMYIKGSPEKIQELCDPASIPHNFHSTLQKYTEVKSLMLENGFHNFFRKDIEFLHVDPRVLDQITEMPCQSKEKMLKMISTLLDSLSWKIKLNQSQQQSLTNSKVLRFELLWLQVKFHFSSLVINRQRG